MTRLLFLYLLCDVEVARVDAVREQILGAAALTGAKHAVVGLEQLPAGHGGGHRSNKRREPRIWKYCSIYCRGYC